MKKFLLGMLLIISSSVFAAEYNPFEDIENKCLSIAASIYALQTYRNEEPATSETQALNGLREAARIAGEKDPVEGKFLKLMTPKIVELVFKHLPQEDAMKIANYYQAKCVKEAYENINKELNKRRNRAM